MTRVRTPIADHSTWWDRAACAGTDPSLWFADGHEDDWDRLAREAVAAAICDVCPVFNQCAESAIAGPEEYGFWAGMNADELRRTRRRRYKAAVKARGAS